MNCCGVSQYFTVRWVWFNFLTSRRDLRGQQGLFFHLVCFYLPELFLKLGSSCLFLKNTNIWIGWILKEQFVLFSSSSFFFLLLNSKAHTLILMIIWLLPSKSLLYEHNLQAYSHNSHLDATNLSHTVDFREGGCYYSILGNYMVILFIYFFFTFELEIILKLI